VRRHVCLARALRITLTVGPVRSLWRVLSWSRPTRQSAWTGLLERRAATGCLLFPLLLGGTMRARHLRPFRHRCADIATSSRHCSVSSPASSATNEAAQGGFNAG
jgi:hypothetical protein